jgi:N-acetylglucosaminyldiphosphoundecaprenol N-acetyl-beta-D-mannosaminyltransferase
MVEQKNTISPENRASITPMLGVKIGTQPLTKLIHRALEAIGGTKKSIIFACANPHSLVVASTNKPFQEALNSADQLVADGVGVVLGGKLSGLKIKPRITGSDYFFALMNELNHLGDKRVFFLGSTNHVLNRIKLKAHDYYPGINAIETLSPPFGDWSDEENNAILKTINHFQPDVLWVGMTAPKQETWVHRNRDALNASVVGSIGAVFDFYAETQPRAPRWMYHNGLEWLYRMFREPRRMWRRNFISTPRFLALILRERIQRRSSPNLT